MSITYIQDLEELENIIDNLPLSHDKHSQERTYCRITMEDENELVELVFKDFDNYLRKNIHIMSSYTFDNIITEEINTYIIEHIREIYTLMYEDKERVEEIIEEEDTYIKELTEYIKGLYFMSNTIKPRTLTDNYDEKYTKEDYKKMIDDKLKVIYEKDKNNPRQRTKEWFMKRRNMISASTFWKCIDSKNCKSSYIYSKCKPLEISEDSGINLNSPFQWGVKYEPVSQMYYEMTRNTRIREFGSIQHSVYDFIGASPDGINIKRDNYLYGRMLEIKNIVNREITGIPKKEYWIQTQIQMECCDLEECDFLECRFIEYSSFSNFMEDGTFTHTKDNKLKGVIMLFTHENNVFYEYLPFHSSEEDYHKWNDEMMIKHKEKDWVQNYYWYLDEVSCVLIPRNREWFSAIIEEAKEVWNTIIKERDGSYESRKPKSRKQNKKDDTSILLLKVDTRNI